MEQRTPEWYQARCGKVTASRITDVMARTKVGWGAARAKYIDQLVAERLSGKPQDMRNVRSMTDRAEMEPEARTAYEFYTDRVIETVGFVPHPTIENAGASPDGNVGDDGGVEIKCLDASNHSKLLLRDDSPMLDYLPQMDFQMACTGGKWVDFVAYCPIMPEELKLIVKRVDRDDERIAKIESGVIQFLAEVDVKVQQVLALANGKSPLTVALEQSLEKAHVV
jgi:predicted phage-related endonuclease